MFAQLQEQIALRKKRLANAAEIHRFNRDMNELISRIQEKDAKLTLDDLGRDLASAEALQRKHEVFKRELMSVERQVDELLAESTRLQNTYQGTVKFTHFLFVCVRVHQRLARFARSGVPLFSFSFVLFPL